MTFLMLTVTFQPSLNRFKCEGTDIKLWNNEGYPRPSHHPACVLEWLGVGVMSDLVWTVSTLFFLSALLWCSTVSGLYAWAFPQLLSVWSSQSMWRSDSIWENEEYRSDRAYKVKSMLPWAFTRTGAEVTQNQDYRVDFIFFFFFASCLSSS